MSEDSTGPISHDTAFDLLSNARRRFVLRRLQEADDGIKLGDLATELSAVENGIPAEELSDKQRKRTYVSLYQTHIPKLEESGIITYDGDSGVVRPTDRLGELAAYFDSEPNRIPWRWLYLVFGGGGLILYAIAFAVDFRVVGPAQVGLGVLVAVAALSLVHYAHARWYRKDTVRIPLERE
ncbi:DUF7344 domain-containing protein [Natronomonas marina]|jgi:hypothetical protein|uniref:DUF7344 domain-containing protein n=1 Tax=Natronomonas marina TaxID=2961939 RepID=UPI0020C9F1D1|nr:hypothetical protein [Natronomonas marina]